MSDRSDTASHVLEETRRREARLRVLAGDPYAGGTETQDADLFRDLLALTATLTAEQETADARIRGVMDFLHGQPREMPYRGSTGQAKESLLNLAWCLGYDCVVETDVWKLLISRADRSANQLDKAEADLSALRVALEEISGDLRRLTPNAVSSLFADRLDRLVHGGRQDQNQAAPIVGSQKTL